MESQLERLNILKINVHYLVAIRLRRVALRLEFKLFLQRVLAMWHCRF